LLRRLKGQPVNARVVEVRTLADGKTVHIVVANMPEFPFGRQKPVWYPITLEPGQEEVDRASVITSKPAIHDHPKTGQRDLTLD
jgi:hypothetical protein